jgi:hypothetical protein
MFNGKSIFLRRADAFGLAPVGDLADRHAKRPA